MISYNLENHRAARWYMFYLGPAGFLQTADCVSFLQVSGALNHFNSAHNKSPWSHTLHKRSSQTPVSDQLKTRGRQIGNAANRHRIMTSRYERRCWNRLIFQPQKWPDDKVNNTPLGSLNTKHMGKKQDVGGVFFINAAAAATGQWSAVCHWSSTSNLLVFCVYSWW